MGHTTATQPLRAAFEQLAARTPELQALTYPQAMANPTWRQVIECRARAQINKTNHPQHNLRT